MSTSLISIQTGNPTGKKYWRSLNQLADTPEFREFVAREFPASATEMLDGKSRRTVLKLMAASFGLAGLTACRRPVEHVFPVANYTTDAENYAPGEAYFYATVHSMGGHVTGLLAETHDGRPTKIEGNPDHPHSLGAATAFEQATVLGVYDPDRSAKILQGGKEATWADFEGAVSKLPLADGAGLRFLSETVTSPSLADLRTQALKKFPKAKWAEYDPISRDNELDGTAMAFGQPLYVHPHFDQASVIVALDFDFLGLDSPSPFMTKLFSKGRRIESEEDLDKMNRLYAVESQFSITGATADHRLRMKGSDVRQFAMDLAAALGAMPGLNVVNNGGAADKRVKFLAALVKDLKAAGAKALVTAGPRQPAGVQAIAALINQALGSACVTYTKPVIDKSNSGADALKTLTGEMTSGQVSTLFILGGNPVYTAPADLQFGVALSKVQNSIHLGLDEDETAAASKWHVPEAHYLESWGDQATSEGLGAIQQPMIEPLYGGRTAAEIVAVVIGNKDTKAHDIVKNYWTAQFTGNKQDAWKKALHDGVVAGMKTAETLKVTVDAKKLATSLAAEPKAATGGLEIGFYPSSGTWDGRFANNGWLQELPDAMTKLTWGNAAMLSPATARAQNVTDGDIITLSRGAVKMEAAVMIQPGHADDAISIALGYGRQRCGRVGKDIGFNANLIRTSDGFWFSPGFALAATGKKHVHATTQEHGAVNEVVGSAERQNGRPLVREGTAAEYKRNPKFAEEMQEVPELHSIYPEVKYDTGYQWGMSIDMTSCTGCNACVIACTAENNIPVVGKDQVLRQREMHWIRIDRYYTGDEDDPQTVEQPIPCMQCENAPCENVCPVQATSHSPEGLNDMAYNRCVGTRYCANNCPFKVRHFNFLNFHRRGDEPENLTVGIRLAEPEIVGLVYNPDVTVRMRGVMEKCTYCVQRIEEVRIHAKVDGRRAIKDGEIKTACQQTCPADAIVFGNINDPDSRVSKLKKQERNYAMLAEMDIKPRTTYLAKLRNPNPELTA
ncbi:MAG TPA: TAT-variant-translocated molybdopterin oxidoreductase [Bryobacteraceae bacterium]|nr:TAT-variant-translocated molybdopterin oxidoreductase [Bryobacteraceae bacterium]